MPKKNSIGSILLIVGLFLSGSLYCLIWMVWPDSVTKSIELQLHDTYIVLHPLFVFVGIFAVAFNLFLIPLQLFKRFKINLWNVTHLFSLLVLGGFVFYGREVLRFGFVLACKSLFQSSAGWTIYPPLSAENGADLNPHWTDRVAGIVPELMIITVVLFAVLLSVRMYRLNKKSYNSTL